MNKTKKCISLLLVCCLLLSLFAGCEKSGRHAVKSSADIDDSVRLKLPVSRSDSLDPFEAETEFNRELSTLLFDSLVKVKNDFTTEKVIAKDIRADGTVITVTLNDMVFSDGTPITVQDVAYSFNRAKESDMYEKRLENFVSAAGTGNAVVFTLEHEDLYAENCLDFPVMKDDDENMIGSGKYKFESSEMLIMNERWYDASLPNVRRIELVNMLDITAGISCIEAGSISFLFCDLSEGYYTRINASMHELPMTNLVFLGMNSSQKELSNAPVRQAISLVINKNNIVDNAYLGYAKIARTPFHPDWNILSELVLDDTDPENAKSEAVALLTDAGYDKVSEFGIRYGSNALTLSLIVNADNAFRVSVANEIASNLKTIGVYAQVKPLPWDEYKSALEKGDYDLYIGEVKLTNNMSLSPFFESGGASYGIDTDSNLAGLYDEFRKGAVTLQKFVDSFDVAVPFVPICYRNGIAAYTNEMQYEEQGTVGDIFENIYTWRY